jgi:hypothetical protein
VQKIRGTADRAGRHQVLVADLPRRLRNGLSGVRASVRAVPLLASSCLAFEGRGMSIHIGRKHEHHFTVASYIHQADTIKGTAHNLDDRPFRYGDRSISSLALRNCHSTAVEAVSVATLDGASLLHWLKRGVRRLAASALERECTQCGALIGPKYCFGALSKWRMTVPSCGSDIGAISGCRPEPIWVNRPI